MGNRHKFGLSEMMSSGSWLYNKLTLNHPKPPSPRLKPLSKSKSKPRTVTTAATPPSPCDSNPRKSYHFGRELNQEQHVKSPRKTKKAQVDAKCSLSSSASSASNTTTCFSPSCRGSRRPLPGFRFDRVLTPDPVDKTTSSSSSSSSSVPRSLSDPDVVGRDIAVGVVKLAPIVTTKKKKNERKLGTSSTANSPGMRLRTHSPRLLATAKRTQARKAAAARPRRSGHETNGKCGGLAVVKSSLDPWKDFRESMVEMIVENGIKDSKGLEELLACYLSLNSEEYHEVIVAVFKQIWCDLTDITFA